MFIRYFLILYTGGGGARFVFINIYCFYVHGRHLKNSKIVFFTRQYFPSFCDRARRPFVTHTYTHIFGLGLNKFA